MLQKLAIAFVCICASLALGLGNCDLIPSICNMLSLAKAGIERHVEFQEAAIKRLEKQETPEAIFNRSHLIKGRDENKNKLRVLEDAAGRWKHFSSAEQQDGFLILKERKKKFLEAERDYEDIRREIYGLSLRVGTKEKQKLKLRELLKARKHSDEMGAAYERLLFFPEREMTAQDD